MAKLHHNRAICMGDMGESSVRISMTRREKKEAQRNRISVIKIRMREWSDDFVKKVYYENQVPDWHQAAKETLNERGVPRDSCKKPNPPKPKKKKKWDRGTPAERQARSTNWKLDRQLDQRLHNEP